MYYHFYTMAWDFFNKCNTLLEFIEEQTHKFSASQHLPKQYFNFLYFFFFFFSKKEFMFHIDSLGTKRESYKRI